MSCNFFKDKKILTEEQWRANHAGHEIVEGLAPVIQPSTYRINQLTCLNCCTAHVVIRDLEDDVSSDR